MLCCAHSGKIYGVFNVLYIYFKIVNVDMFTVWWYEDRFTVWLVCGQVYSVLICVLPEVGWSDLCAARSCHHQQT